MQPRHAGMAFERTHLLVTWVARNPMPHHQRMPRPRPPLPRLIRPAEQDHRERARRRRRSAAGPESRGEEISPLRGTRSSAPRSCSPSSRAQQFMQLDASRKRNVINPTDNHHPPASREKTLNQQLPRPRPATASPHFPAPQVNGQQAAEERRKAIGVQPARGLLGSPSTRSTATTRRRAGAAAPRPATPLRRLRALAPSAAARLPPAPRVAMRSSSRTVTSTRARDREQFPVFRRAAAARRLDALVSTR